MKIEKNKNLKQDKTAKCLSYNVKELPFLLKQEDYKNMMQLSNKNNRCNVRICFHKNKDSLHHDMIILERNKNVYPPHKHFNKGECFHVIKGKLKVLIFNNKGKIIKKIILMNGDVFRIKENSYHAVIALSDPVIYHESKPGPFLGDKDSVIPKWVPKQEKALHLYKSHLLEF